MTTALHTVHVRVNDAATGQPTPVRLRISGPQGEYYAPLGRLSEFATGVGEDVGGNLSLRGTSYAYIDGTCEVRLPGGPLVVEIHKGPEYVPLRQELNLAPGKLALRFTIERWANLREQGWYSGDTGAFFLSPHAALLEGAAEDLAVVNLLAGEFSLKCAEEAREVPCLPNILAFSGQRPALEMPGHMVVVNTYNQHPVLGSLGLLNCHRAVYPLRFGGPDGLEDWALADWCDQCHRKGGLVVWWDFENYRLGASSQALGSEGLAALLLGKVDTLQIMDMFWSIWLEDLYTLWNVASFVPLVGGGNKEDNVLSLGHTRTYARLRDGEPFTYKSWIESVRAGRTFVSNGPLLFFAVNGAEPGSTIDVADAAGCVHVRVEARSHLPFERLELVANGKVVASASGSGAPVTAQIETDLRLNESAWLAARCEGPHEVAHAGLIGSIAAHSSAIHVRLDGRPLRAEPASGVRLVRRLDAGLEWIRSQGRFETEQQRQHLTGIFQSARDELLQRLGFA